MNLWNDTFNIRLYFNNPHKNERSEKVETYKGSLRSAIRHYIEKYKHTHVVISFYSSDDKWIKEIGW